MDFHRISNITAAKPRDNSMKTKSHTPEAVFELLPVFLRTGQPLTCALHVNTWPKCPLFAFPSFFSATSEGL